MVTATAVTEDERTVVTVHDYKKIIVYGMRRTEITHARALSMLLS